MIPLIGSIIIVITVAIAVWVALFFFRPWVNE